MSMYELEYFFAYENQTFVYGCQIVMKLTSLCLTTRQCVLQLKHLESFDLNDSYSVNIWKS